MSALKLSLSKDANKNYIASVVQLKSFRPIKGADRLKVTNIFGYDVVVDVSAKEGDVGVFFPIESQISEWFLHTNNQYKNSNKNIDLEKKGFFEEKGRVRAIKFKGQKSEGFYIPIAGITVESVGQDFDTIGDDLLVKKYVVKEIKTPGTPGKKGDKKIVKRFDRIVDKQFRLHVDTAQLKKNVHQLEIGDYIGVHYKKHGTSWVVSNCLVRKDLTRAQRIAKWLGFPINDLEYDIVYSSRKVIKNQYINKDQKNGYYNYDLWRDIAERVGNSIPKGWTLYGEAIGFLPDGGFIQGGYDYGCRSGEFKVYVYRITVTNPDGQVIELDDKQIGQFCDRHGMLYSDTLLFYGTVAEHFDMLFAKYHDSYYVGRQEEILTSVENDTEEWRQIYIEMLIKEYNDKRCYMCSNKVPEEGIIIRKQDLWDFNALKMKSYEFVMRETSNLDNGEIDLESQS